MNIFERIFDFFTNSNVRFFSKIRLFLIGAIAILSVDYFFRFSDTYITNIKIKQIEQIEAIIRKDSIRNEAKKELIRIENRVIERQGFWDLSSSLASLIQVKINSASTITNTYNETSPVVKRSVFWHYATSGSMLWLFIIFSPIMMFQKNTNTNGIVGIIFFDIVCAALALFLAYALAFIPILWHPVVNYAINILCSAGPFFIMFRAIMKMGNGTT